MVNHEYPLLKDVRSYPFGQLVNSTKNTGIDYSIGLLLTNSAYLDSLATHALAEMLNIRLLSICPFIKEVTNVFDVSSGTTQYNVKAMKTIRTAIVLWSSALPLGHEYFQLNHFTALVPKEDERFSEEFLRLKEKAKKDANKKAKKDAKEKDKKDTNGEDKQVSKENPKQDSKLSSSSDHEKTVKQSYLEPSAPSAHYKASEPKVAEENMATASFEPVEDNQNCQPGEWDQDELDNLSECSNQTELNLMFEKEKFDDQEEEENENTESPFKSMVIEYKVPEKDGKSQPVEDKEPEAEKMQENLQPEGLKCRKFEKFSKNKFLPYNVSIPFMATVVDGEDGVYLDRDYPPSGEKLGKKMITSCSENLNGFINRDRDAKGTAGWKADYNDDYSVVSKVLTDMIVLYHNPATNKIDKVEGVKFSNDEQSLVPKYDSRPPKKETYQHLQIENCFRIKITRHYYEHFSKKTSECFDAPEPFKSAVGRAFVEYSEGDETKARKPRAHGNARKSWKVCSYKNHNDPKNQMK